MRFFRPFGRIKALSFDLDDTLYDNVPVMERAERWLAVQVAVRFSLRRAPGSEFWQRAVGGAIAENPNLAHDVTQARVFGIVRGLALLGVKTPDALAAAKRLIEDFIAVRSQITVPPSSLKLLGDLRRRYRLCAVSNGNSHHDQTGLAGLFDFDLRPGADGLRRKPHPDLFLRSAALFKCDAAQILHVGDDPYTDVEGALRAGVRCAWLRGGIAAKVDVRGLRVLPDLELDSIEDLRFLL